MRPFVLLSVSLLAFNLSLTAQTPRSYSRVLFIGNSITRCPSDSTIEWYGTWGMAASSSQSDYVHRVVGSLTARQGFAPAYSIQSASPFERHFMRLDIPLWLAPIDTLHPDLIIVQLGENIRPDTATKYDLQASYRALLESVKAKAPAARILALTTFWATKSVDSMITNAAGAAGVIYIDISHIYKDTLNRATSERAFENRDVGSHPGDRGMGFIAQAILEAAATAVDEEDLLLPTRFVMDLFPNPFNGASVIQLTLSQRKPVHLRVVNMLGEEVTAYFAGYLEAGTHRIPISMGNLPSGSYIIEAALGDRSLHKKALLIR